MKPTAIFALTLVAAVPAVALNNLTWVSQRSGIDNGTCGAITSPCKTFQTAHDNTNNNGIVKALDAGEYGFVSINKPIVIDGNGVGVEIEATSVNNTGVFVSTA